MIHEDDAGVFFNTDEFGQAATYTPRGGAAVSCTVVLERNVEREGTDGIGVVNAFECSFQRSEVSSPIRNAAVVVDGTTYLLEERIDEDESHVVMTAKER